MTKFFCTLTIFVLIVGAFVASCVIWVHTPLWFESSGGELPLIIPLAAGCTFLIIVGFVIYGAWVWADLLCTSLRKALDRRRAKFAQKWSER